MAVLADRRAMSNEEEGSAKDDWKVLGFQNCMGGGAIVTAGGQWFPCS